MIKARSSFESNLLFATPCVLDPDHLAENMRETISDHGVAVHETDISDGAFLLMTCDGFQILVAFSDAPLPADHFQQAGRPGSVLCDELQMLDLLDEHRANATILVMKTAMDSGLELSDDMRSDICWDLTDCIAAMTSPDLVFWCDTDTLYAAEEFEQACTHLAVDPEPVEEYLDVMPSQSRTPPHFMMDPVFSEERMASLDLAASASPRRHGAVWRQEIDFGATKRDHLDRWKDFTGSARTAKTVTQKTGTATLHRAVSGFSMVGAMGAIALYSHPILLAIGF